MITGFRERVMTVNPDYIVFDRLRTLQVNVGNLCNQSCEHCHIEAGPDGKNIMSEKIVAKIVSFVKSQHGLSVDITGGSPQLNPSFRFLVEMLRPYTSRIIVRTNLTILLEEGMEWLPDFYKKNRIVLVGSLPCYTKENVDKQRGEGIFEKSIRALRALNRIGYGDCLELNLVYNPGGDFLPAPQEDLECDYRKHLLDEYGIRFSNLFTITNAPIGRFRRYLRANGRMESYLDLLSENFNPEIAGNIMCRSLVSVGWRGRIYNCDFNQAEGMPIRGDDGRDFVIDDLGSFIEKRPEIVMGDHCYCCTAGAGSSCTGALL